ncbi:MAG: IS1-like element transposase [Xenococcus sp. MO_188.B8]|nr:IS1-like element transposase [Xenococcus sp. MO_188.B8]
MTVFITVTCPDCHSTNVVKHGKSGEGKQRYCCRNEECLRRTFLLDYSYEGHKRSVKKKIADMSVNGSGVRDTARVLKVSTSTVIKEIKKTKKTQEC